MSQPGFNLVLSGGGLKGLAFCGVLRALDEYGLVPNLVVGTSIGALVGAAWASGMSVAEMTDRALRLRRRDIFQIAHVDMAVRRLHAPALYKSRPLAQLIHSLIGDITFQDLSRTLLVNTTELCTGRQVVWSSGSTRVADVVFASCALPGMFEPKEIDGHYYVDGAVTENLPVRVAAHTDRSPILAVNVSATNVHRDSGEIKGFANTYIRGLEIVMQNQISNTLRNWDGPPLVLLEPPVTQLDMFSCSHTAELIEAGYTATCHALKLLGGIPEKLEHIQEVPRWPPLESTRLSSVFTLLPAPGYA